MKNKKRALLVILAATLLLASTVLGTMAWLYDIDDEPKQEFTAGDIGIDLVVDTIPGLNSTQDTNDDNDDKELVPNKTYALNPTVTVDAGSEECFVRVFVYITDAADVIATMGTNLNSTPEKDIFLPHTCVAGWDASKWTHETINASNYQNYIVDDTLVYEFRYYTTVAEAQVDTTLESLFTTFTLPYWLNNDDIDDLCDENPMTIKFEAQAIQAKYVNGTNLPCTADQAWAAFDQQINGTANVPANPNLNSSLGDNYPAA